MSYFDSYQIIKRQLYFRPNWWLWKVLINRFQWMDSTIDNNHVYKLHSVYLYSISVWFDNNLHIQYSFQLKYYVKFTDVPELYILFVILSINIWIKIGCFFSDLDIRIGFEKWRKCWKKWERISVILSEA